MTTGPGPYCLGCKHADRSLTDAPRCTAYPDGIPPEIWGGDVDHRMPYPGDHGIVYEGSADWGEVSDGRLVDLFDGDPDGD